MTSIMRLVLGLILAGLFFLPLVFWPWAKIPYEIPKVWFVARWVEALVIGSLISRPKLNHLNTKLLAVLTVFTAVVSVSVLTGVDSVKSIFGNYYRQDGLLTFYHLVGFSLVVGLVWRDAWKNLLAKTVVIANTLTAVISFWGEKWPDGGVGGLFGQPNFLAGYFLVCLPLAFYLLNISTRREKIAVSIAIFIQILAIFFSRSIVALVGVGILFSLLVVYYQKKLGIILLAIFALMFVGISINFFTNQKNKPFLVTEGRQRIYTKVFLGALKKPLLGYGIANVDYAFEAVDWPIKIRQDVYVDKAHSQLLEIFATTGGVGLVSYLTLIGLVLVNHLKKITDAKEDVWQYSLLASLILYLFHSQTNVISISQEIIFYFILGTNLAIKRKNLE